MATPLCAKCGRRNIGTYQVEPQETWRLFLANRWKSICPSCFDAEAEHAGVRDQFMGTRARSWSDASKAATRPTRKRR
jgi:hypothetical protein